jgi:hypothetical protein
MKPRHSCPICATSGRYVLNRNATKKSSYSLIHIANNSDPRNLRTDGIEAAVNMLITAINLVYIVDAARAFGR